MKKTLSEVIDGFLSRATKNGTCLEHTQREKYGKTVWGGKVRRLSHLVWKLNKGEWPGKLFVCHTCDNPRCFNIDHLWLGTNSDNILDMYKKGRRKVGALQARKARETQGPWGANPTLSLEQVIEVHQLLAKGIKGRRIAEKFCVHEQVISCMKLGKRYRLTPETIAYYSKEPR